MNKQEELLEQTIQKEEKELRETVKELSRQYESGEISKMDVLVAIRDVLARLN